MAFVECIGCKDPCCRGDNEVNISQIPRSARSDDASDVVLNFESAPFSSGGLTSLRRSSTVSEQNEEEEEPTPRGPTPVARTLEADEESGKPKDEDEDLEGCPDCCGVLLDHHMDELEVMQKTWWCCYCCCCAGCGSGPREPIRFKYFCVLCDGFCQSADLLELKDGVCHCVWDCCGCHCLSQLPWREDTPRCAVCNRHFFGWHKKHDGDHSPEEAHSAHVFEHVTHELFNLLYLSFCGCAVAEPTSQIETLCKCCCCRANCQQALPSEEECCACLCSLINLHLQCRMPPKAEENPLCAMCGKKIRRKRLPGFVDHMLGVEEKESPKQQKMQGHDEFASGVVTLADIPEFE